MSVRSREREKQKENKNKSKRENKKKKCYVVSCDKNRKIKQRFLQIDI